MDLKKKLIEKYVTKHNLKKKHNNISPIPFIFAAIAGFFLGLGPTSLLYALKPTLISQTAPVFAGIILMIISPIATGFWLNKKHFGKVNKEIKLLEKQVRQERHESQAQLVQENFEVKSNSLGLNKKYEDKNIVSLNIKSKNNDREMM